MEHICEYINTDLDKYGIAFNLILLKVQNIDYNQDNAKIDSNEPSKSGAPVMTCFNHALLEGSKLYLLILKFKCIY